MAILDERIEAPAEKTPDIGVVIEQSPAETSPVPGQQRLGLGKEIEMLDEPAHLMKGLHSAPGALETPWPAVREMFGPSAPHRIVKAGLRTPVVTLIDRSCGFSASKKLWSYKFSTGMLLRLVFEDSMIDVPLTPGDLEEPDLTVEDLLTKTAPQKL